MCGNRPVPNSVIGRRSERSPVTRLCPCDAHLARPSHTVDAHPGAGYDAPQAPLLDVTRARLFEHTRILYTSQLIEMPRRSHRSVIAVAIVAAALAAGSATLAAQDGVRTTPPPEPSKPFLAFGRSALTLGDSIVTLAREQLGKRYVFGGTSPRRGFDCSGLVKYIATALHIDIPRTARMQAQAGEAVAKDTSQLLPGDLVTFGRGSRISHIGIYVGNGRFIHASTKAGRVIETWLIRKPARGIKPWQGVRRLAMIDSSAVSQDDAIPFR